MRKYLALLTIFLVVFGTFLGIPTPQWWDDIVKYFTDMINTNLQIIKTVYEIIIILQKLAEAYQQIQNQTMTNQSV